MSQLWLPLFAAGLRAAALPGWWAAWLVPLALVPRLAWWERAQGRRRFLGDWLGGTVFWALGFSFLSHTYWALPLGPAPILGLWWGLEGVLQARLRRRLPPAFAALLAIVLVESLRACFPMGGVPWASWGLGLAGLPGVLAAASVVGEGGIGVLVLLAGAFLWSWSRPSTPRERWIPLVGAVAVAVAAILAPSRGALEPLDCLAIQPNVLVEEKSGDGGLLGIFNTHTRLGELAVGHETQAPADSRALPELLIWAETMFLFPTVADDAEGVIRIPRRAGGLPYEWSVPQTLELQRRAAARAATILRPGGWFLTGAHAYQPLQPGAPPARLSPRGSASLLFQPDGTLVSSMRKTRLVPFGERLPFGGRFPGAGALADWIFRAFGLHPTFVAGAAPAAFRFPRPAGEEVVLGVAICWENVYESVFRRQADAGAEAFVVLSNEAWYGTGAEMDQMVAATRFRAAETGRAVLRATNNGLTVLVGPQGELAGGIPRGEEGSFRCLLPRVPGGQRTLYLAGGWLVQPLVALLAVLAVLATLAPSRRRPGAPTRLPA